MLGFLMLPPLVTGLSSSNDIQASHFCLSRSLKDLLKQHQVAEAQK